MARRAAFSLVELLVAVALTTILVGITATAFLQTQRAVRQQAARQEVAWRARALLDDLGRDISNIRSRGNVTGTNPFGTVEEPVLELEAIDSRLEPRDRLKIQTSVGSPDDGQWVPGVVEYSVDPPQPNPDGGPDLCAIRRAILSYSRPGEASPQPGPPSSVITRRALSFRLEWQDPSTGAFVDPDERTVGASPFSYRGLARIQQVPGQGTQLIARDDDARLALEAIPVGRQLELLIDDAPTRFLIRRKLGPGVVMINDRVDDTLEVTLRVFAPPSLVRVTVTFPAEAGPNPQTARFSRSYPIPR